MSVLGERVEVVVSEFIGSPIYLKIYPPVIHPESGPFYRWYKLQACWSNRSVCFKSWNKYCLASTPMPKILTILAMRIGENSKLVTCLLPRFITRHMPWFGRWLILVLGTGQTHCCWRKPQDDWSSAALFGISSQGREMWWNLPTLSNDNW